MGSLGIEDVPGQFDHVFCDPWTSDAVKVSVLTRESFSDPFQ